MDDVAAREVPVYFEVEEEIISAPSKVMHRIVRSPFLPLPSRDHWACADKLVSALSHFSVAVAGVLRC